MIKTREEQIYYIENYFESRFNNFIESGDFFDALAVYKELILVDGEEPDDWLFLQFIEEIQ